MISSAILMDCLILRYLYMDYRNIIYPRKGKSRSGRCYVLLNNEVAIQNKRNDVYLEIYLKLTVFVKAKS